MAQIYSDRQVLVDVNELQHTDRYFSSESQYYRTQFQAGRETDRRYESEPRDYMCSAMMACMCCCLPLGLIAMYFANSANDARAQGHFEEARKKNRVALILIISSVISGILIAGAFVFIQFYLQQ